MTAIEVYRDAVCYAVINDDPITLGHVRIFPHSGAHTLEDMKAKDVTHLYKVASICASMLFEGMKAQGTNIMCHNGADEASSVYIDVIARFQEDNLGLLWQPKQGNPEEIATVAKQIKSAIIPVETKPDEPIIEESPDVVGNDGSQKPDLRIDHIRRIP
jgi:diadenosine tetraphosphate (Ap4A) HIT family hydrolase